MFFFFWYSLCVDCLQALCCQRAFPKVQEVTRRHWSYAKEKKKQNKLLYIPAMWFKEQWTTSLWCKVLCCVLVFVVHTSVSDGRRGRKRKWVITSGKKKKKSCFFTIGSASQWNVKGAILCLLIHTKMLLWMTFLLSTLSHSTGYVTKCRASIPEAFHSGLNMFYTFFFSLLLFFFFSCFWF